jgi:hypothetical protein
MYYTQDLGSLGLLIIWNSNYCILTNDLGLSMFSAYPVVFDIILFSSIALQNHINSAKL